MTSLQISDDSLNGAFGKVVIITGGASGIGKAAVELFHSLGSKVVFGDLNEKAGNEIEATLGQNIVFQSCDVTKWDSLTRLFKTAVKEFGIIDIVLANAGVPEIEDFFADTFEANGDLQEPKYIVLDVNLKGVLATVKLAKYFFDKQNSPGSILLTSSTGGVTGDTYLPVYMTSKHGLIGLMRSLGGAHESPFSKNKIRVNCVAPFMTDSGFLTDELRTELERGKVPVNKASIVARAMVYLGVTEDISGQTIYVADDEFTELEGPIRALRTQWLGEKNSRLLGLVTFSRAMAGKNE
ncbi:hypothetical protein ACLOAV_008465 [Pseudogymnoascus australis]